MNKLTQFFQIVTQTTIPITSMYPTHITSRGKPLLEDGKKWVGAGGVVDFTADADGEHETELALLDYYDSGVDMTKITLSSDAYGSLPTYNSDGILIGYDMALPISVLNQMRTMILKV
jgi:beta-aspartyl-dipeptidase (metallo-type)